MDVTHRHPQGGLGGFLLPLGIGAVLGFAAAKARSAANYARVAHPSMQGVLHTGAWMLQSKPPLDAMSMFLNGFHFYADDMGRQVEAVHFCTT